MRDKSKQISGFVICVGRFFFKHADWRQARRVRTLLIILVLSFIPWSSYGASVDKTAEKVLIGVLYRNTATGLRYRDAIHAAYNNSAGLSELVEIKDFPYADEKLGTKTLVNLIKREKDKISILFGPTESDVYVRALEQRSELEKHEVPLISSVVTADVPHVRSGWFFLTNVDVQRRAQAAYDYLNKYWINSIAILYANTEFGRRAERAFRAELNDAQKHTYSPMPYSLPATSARSQIRQLLERRPEAIGIFGEREDLQEIYAALSQMNSGATPYHPIIFTIIDARTLVDNLDDLHFVSVTRADEPVRNGQQYDDVMTLAYDTTKLVLQEIKKLADQDILIASAAGRREFRDRFEAILRATPLLTDTISGITFSNYKNVAKTRMISMKGGALKEFDLTETVGFEDKIQKKSSLLANRYGAWPWVNAVLLILIVVMMSILDLKKWYTGNTWRLILESHFYILLAVNASLVLALYVYMGETGAIRYDSIMAALIIAFAPLALLRTTFFETSTGKSVGLAKLYDGFLQWINDHLMVARHSRTSLYVNLIAFHNTVDGMRTYLRDIYREQPSAERRIKLETELAELVNDSIPYLERRKVCARILLRTKKWDELRLDGMAPQGDLPLERTPSYQRVLSFFKNEPMDIEDQHCEMTEVHKFLRDPEVVIKQAARFCATHREATEKLEKEIGNHLKNITDTARKQSLENALQQDLIGVIGEQARLRRKIAFLFILRGYDEQYLRGCLGMDESSVKVVTPHIPEHSQN